MILTNVVLYNRDSRVLYNLVCKDGIITEIMQTKKHVIDKDDIVVDCCGMTLIPGLCDLHTHIRDDPRETLESGLTAALYGGFTDVVCMANMNPVLDNVETIINLKEKAKNINHVGFHLASALTKGQNGLELVDMDAISPHVVMFTDDGNTNENGNILLQGLKKTNKPVAVHAEDHSIRCGGLVNQNIANELKVQGNSEYAESVRIARDIEILHSALQSNPDANLHIQHVSTQRGLKLIGTARRMLKSQNNLTCEVTPHHLTLNDEHLVRSDNRGLFKVAPPLRDWHDQVYIRLHMAYVDAIATDHAPHMIENKMDPELSKVSFGIPSLEIAFPLLYTEFCVNTNLYDLRKLIEFMAFGPRKIIGLEKNEIKLGNKLNGVLVDLQSEYEVDPLKFKSNAKYSPWTGRVLKGWPKIAFINDNVYSLSHPSV